MSPIRHLALLAVVALLAGCQTISGWFSSDEEINPPTELQPIQQSAPVTRIWSANVGEGIDRSTPALRPVMDGDTIWTADHEGLVTAISVDNGSVTSQWETELDLSAGPGVQRDVVMFGTFDGGVHVFDRASGGLRWNARVSSEVLARPVLHDGVVIVRCIDGRVFGFDVNDGTRMWVYDRSIPLLTLRGNSEPLVRGGQVFIGYDDGTVAALRVEDGSVVWEQRVSSTEGRSELDRLVDIDGSMAIVATDLYVVTYRGRLAGMALESGRMLWVKDVASYTGLTVDRTDMAVTDRDGNVWLVDRRNGSTLWRSDSLLYRDLTRAVFQGDYLVMGDFDGYLHWMNTESGQFAARVEAFDGPLAGAPIVSGRMLYAQSADGQLSAWRLGSGE